MSTSKELYQNWGINLCKNFDFVRHTIFYRFWQRGTMKLKQAVRAVKKQRESCRKRVCSELLAISHAKSSGNHMNFRYTTGERDYLLRYRDLQLCIFKDAKSILKMQSQKCVAKLLVQCIDSSDTVTIVIWMRKKTFRTALYRFFVDFASLKTQSWS